LASEIEVEHFPTDKKIRWEESKAESVAQFKAEKETRRRLDEWRSEP
jgi:hypothetical protein